MDVFQIEPGLPSDALLVHQARHIGRYNIFGSMTNLIVGLLQSHPGGHALVGDAERPPKAAAVIRPVHGREHQPLYLRKKVCCLVERNADNLGWLGDSEAANRTATVVNRYRVLKQFRTI